MRSQNRRACLYSVAILGILIGIAGCDSAPPSMPNASGSRRYTTESLFANAVTSAAAIVRSQLDYGQCALWAQQVAAIDGSPDDRYAVDSVLIERTWASLYSGSLEDIEQALNQARADQNALQIAQLLVVRAWTYSYITAVWGDVPFSAADQGSGGVLAPSYDRQSAIYDALLKDLAQSSLLMANATTGGFGTSDPVYAGNLEKWRRFANSLRARLALELSRADASRAKSEVAAAIAAGGFASNDDDATIRWLGDGTNDNPWSRATDNLRLSKTLVDTLLSLADPRLSVYAQPASLSGQYAGAPNGLTVQQGATYVDVASPIAANVARKDMPSSLLTFAEFSLIKAEAAERGWISGSAAQYYADGIRASLQHWGIAAADIDAYLAQPSIQYATGAAGQTQIALQNWIGLYTQGVDAWREWRRSGQPHLIAVSSAQTSPPAIPRRLPYPRSELLRNSANAQRAIAAQGGATLTDRTWIDK